MAPILGIWASARPAAAVDTGAMFPLQVVTVGPAGASSVSFTNIPSTYSHLQVRGIVRTNRSSTEDSFRFQFNSDTGNNYAWHGLEGYTGPATGVGAAAVTSTNKILALGTGANATSGIFSPFIFDILDYANTNKYKTCRLLNGLELNTAASYNYVEFRSGLWLSTNAISSIQLAPENGTAFSEYSQFALYAVKAAS